LLRQHAHTRLAPAAAAVRSRAQLCAPSESNEKRSRSRSVVLRDCLITATARERGAPSPTKTPARGVLAVESMVMLDSRRSVRPKVCTLKEIGLTASTFQVKN
jgi:hypothetical protein